MCGLASAMFDWLDNTPIPTKNAKGKGKEILDRTHGLSLEKTTQKIAERYRNNN